MEPQNGALLFQATALCAGEPSVAPECFSILRGCFLRQRLGPCRRSNFPGAPLGKVLLTFLHLSIHVCQMNSHNPGCPVHLTDGRALTGHRHTCTRRAWIKWCPWPPTGPVPGTEQAVSKQPLNE